MAAAQNNMPALRFPGFNETWITEKLGTCLVRIIDPVKVELKTHYREIGVRSHGRGVFHKEPVSGKSLANKRVFWVHSNSLILNIVFAWEQAVALTTDNERGFIASHRFPMYVPIDDKVNLKFILLFFLRKRGKFLLELASPGGAGRNKTLGQSEFAKLKVTHPTCPEQQKIASFLSSVDTKVEQLNKKKSLLEQYKKGMMQKLFSQEIRFKDEQGKEYPDWEEKRLGDILSYEQPTAYLVKTSDYDDTYTTSVLTAGKTFLLGYTNDNIGIFKDKLPTIIFDDFTTAFKYVDFPFKVKSSAIKILIPKSKNVNIKYVFEAMQKVRFPLGEHKRYWISEYQKEKISYPSKKEQQKIAAFLSAIEKKIELATKQIKQAQLFKKGLLQQMFV